MKRRELTDEERQEAERLNSAWLAYKSANEGATQTWLGAESGIGSQGAVGQYLRGAIPLGVEALVAICRVIGADPEVISPRISALLEVPRRAKLFKNSEGDGGDFLPNPDGAPNESLYANLLPVRSADKDDRDFIQIPMVKLRLQAGVTGFQTEPERRDGGTVGMRRSWIERNDFKPAKLVAIQVRGESMEPSLYEDDIVVINTEDRQPVDGAVFAVNYEGEAVVKRLSRDAGEWWLMSDNSDQRKHHRKVCRGDACIIIGRVVRKESDRI